MSSLTLRRTQTLLPAVDGTLAEGAFNSDADQVVFDLEDSVHPTEKTAARDELITTLDTVDSNDKIVGFRINGVDTRWWYDDVIQVIQNVGEHIDILGVPKITSANQVVAVDKLLTQVEVNAGLEPGTIGLECLVERASAMNNVSEIATASERVETLIFGPGDYSASIGIGGPVDDHYGNYPGHFWHYALSRIVHSAKGAGLQVVDGLYPRVDDTDGFRQLCQWGKMLGCDGKVAINSKQIAIANEVFTPSKAEAEKASLIVETYEDASGTSGTFPTVEGEIIDEETYHLSKQIMARAVEAGVL